MKRFYFVVTFLPLTRDDNFLASQCIRTLHSFNYKHKLNCIGINFPRWTDIEIGNQLAFVCDDIKVINQFRATNYFQQMKQHQLFAISDVCTVQENAQPECRFMRTRKFEKYSANGNKRALQRLKNRALARGETSYQPKSDKPINVTMPHCHQLPLESKSTKQPCFYLHIYQEICDGINVTGYSSYGLATKGELQGSVPLLS